MGEIVEWVNAPFILCVWMRSISDSVDNWISEGGVGVLVIDLSSEHGFTLIPETSLHFLEDSEVFLDWSISEGTWCSILSGLLHFVLGLVADVGLALLDELDSKIVKDLEVIGGVGGSPGLVAEPGDVFDDVINIFLALSFWVGVIESQVTISLVLTGEFELESHRLGVSDVEVTIGFRGESGEDLVTESLLLPLGGFGCVEGGIKVSGDQVSQLDSGFRSEVSGGLILLLGSWGSLGGALLISLILGSLLDEGIIISGLFSKGLFNQSSIDSIDSL